MAWFCLAAQPHHDFHTSLTEIQYNPKSGSLEVTIRVFTDDLEAALTGLNQGKKVSLELNPKGADALIQQYLQKHWGLINPQRQIKGFDYIGKEPELDATWLYVEVPQAQNLKGYTLFNTIFLELFDDQTNLTNVLYPNQRKTILFNQKVKSAPYPF